jgi:hypothetical protein
MKSAKLLSITLLAILLTVSLFADSSTRPKTEVETKFFDEVIRACESAIAGISTTWDEENRSGDENNDRITEDSEKYPLVHYFNVSWADFKRIEEARAVLDKELEALAPKLQEQANSFDSKAFEELAARIGKAAEAGDFATVEKLQKDAEVMAKQLETGGKQMGQQVDDLTEKHTPHDVSLKVRIAVNNFYQNFSSDPATVKLNDGTVCYRVEDSRFSNGSWIEGTTFVFLGNDWKITKDGDLKAMKHPEYPEKPSASVRAIVLSVEAEQKRALAALNSMNLAALKALIK